MQEQKNFSPWRVVVVAAAFIAAAGATAIYVIDRGAGNVETAQCTQAKQRVAAISPFATGEVAAFGVVDEPSPIGPLSFQDGAGQTKSLSEWQGRTVLLNLWATWCAPCRKEMPALDALEETMGGEAFAVVAVSVDLGEADKPKAFYQETGIRSLPFFHDGTMGVFNTLKKKGLAIGMPTTLLVDPNGCLLGVMNGPAEWASQDAIALVKAALEE